MFFPVSNVHKILPNGTVIESPERKKLREDQLIQQAKDKIANLVEEEEEGEEEGKETPGYSRLAHHRTLESLTRLNEQS